MESQTGKLYNKLVTELNPMQLEVISHQLNEAAFNQAVLLVVSFRCVSDMLLLCRCVNCVASLFLSSAPFSS